MILQQNRRTSVDASKNDRRASSDASNNDRRISKDASKTDRKSSVDASNADRRTSVDALKTKIAISKDDQDGGDKGDQIFLSKINKITYRC